MSETANKPEADGELQPPALGESPRLASLDAFRGLVIATMLLVNVTWDKSVFPEQMFHLGWNEGNHGATVTDLVFPWFLFIVGVAIPFSMHSGRGQSRTPTERVLIAFKRGLVLYLLGVLIWMATIANRGEPIGWRAFLHWDILPLIGAGYFLGVVFYQSPAPVRIAFVVIVLLAKWAILRLIPYPPTGEMVWTQSESVHRWLNAQLGWFGGFQQALPAAATVLLGAFAGDLLRKGGRSIGTAGRLLAFGLIFWGASWLWQFQAWAGLRESAPGLASFIDRVRLPYSKDYFTSSYVLLAAGTGACLLAAMYAIVDVWRVARFRWMQIFGLNAIALYFTVEMLWRLVFTRWQIVHPNGHAGSLIGGVLAWLREWGANLSVHLLLGPLGDTERARTIGDHAGAWAHAIGYMLLCWCFVWWLHRRKIYLKV